MERRTFLMRILPGERDNMEQALKEMTGELLSAAARQGIDNFSIWSVCDLLCGYGEFSAEIPADAESELRMKLNAALEGKAEWLCAPGIMRLMYHDIGIVREDKSLIRHRVFVTKLKPGCAEEYKRRHDALIEARGDAVSEGPDSNFTIWYGAGYIFGYCEKVKSFDREMTEQERSDTIAWETRQLEIMDWLTDDVDWITGERHEKIRRVV